jgi:hypothetical protein
MPAIRHVARPAKSRLVPFLLATAALVSAAPALAVEGEEEAEGETIVVPNPKPPRSTLSANRIRW